MAKILILCVNVCARSARTLAAGVQGLLKGPESSGIVDAFWCYIYKPYKPYILNIWPQISCNPRIKIMKIVTNYEVFGMALNYCCVFSRMFHKNFSMLHKILACCTKILACCCDMLKPLVGHPACSFQNYYFLNSIIFNNCSSNYMSIS